MRRKVVKVFLPWTIANVTLSNVVMFAFLGSRHWSVVLWAECNDVNIFSTSSLNSDCICVPEMMVTGAGAGCWVRYGRVEVLEQTVDADLYVGFLPLCFGLLRGCTLFY